MSEIKFDSYGCPYREVLVNGKKTKTFPFKPEIKPEIKIERPTIDGVISEAGDYESPIEVCMQQVMYDLMTKQEDYIIEEVNRCGVTVNKEELTKALAYDRDQYNKGFEAGREWVDAKIYSAYKALQYGFTDEALGYLGELLGDH